MENYTVDNGNIELICDLDLNEYSGKLYEIAKFEAREQKDLENVTAVYSLKDSGKIKVDNSGYKNGKKKGIKASAWLRNKKCKAALYLRFFWPLKSEYNVIKLTSDYRYAVVMGEKKKQFMDFK